MKKILLLSIIICGNVWATNTELRVGPQPGLYNGNTITSRADRTAAQVTTDAHGRYQEAVLSGNVFTTSVKGFTAAATSDISPIPAGGTTPMGIFNPAGSGKNCVILHARCATVSGTPGGPIYWDIIPPPSGITVTVGSATINALTMKPGGNTCLAITNGGVLAGSVLATNLGVMGGPAAIAAGAGDYTDDDEVAGRIVVPPGGFAGISFHAVGTTHVISCGMAWEELPQ